MKTDGTRVVSSVFAYEGRGAIGIPQKTPGGGGRFGAFRSHPVGEVLGKFPAAGLSVGCDFGGRRPGGGGGEGGTVNFPRGG